MNSALQAILTDLRKTATNNRDLGNKFEKLCELYLRHDKSQQQWLDRVRPYADWASEQGISGKDEGIDLVADIRPERGGGYCAIQAKCRPEDKQINDSEIVSFIAETSKRDSHFSAIMLIDSTAVELSSTAHRRLRNHILDYQRVGLETLSNSSINWSSVLDNLHTTPTQRSPKQPRTHQEEAIKAVKEGFNFHDRGQMIMACGTGKTYTGLLVAEQLFGKGKQVLILVPSLALMSQTVNEWTLDASIPLRSYAVCSDRQVGKTKKRSRREIEQDNIELPVEDLVIPATTDAQRLANHASQPGSEKLTVIFGTYQSLGVIEKAQTEFGLDEFDLIICDEAHRTTGQIKADQESSSFVMVHDQSRIRGRKRLYMTATPRIYSEGAVSKAKESGAIELASMSDEKIFGPLFFHRSFAWAIENDLLSDYKVVVLALNEQEISTAVQNFLAKDTNEIQLDMATKLIGCYKALNKESTEHDEFEEDPKPCQTALAFCSTINRSKNEVSKHFAEVVREFKQSQQEESELELDVEHVDGGTPTKTRENLLGWLSDEPNSTDNHCRIISNVRCLGEGVDVPSLDAILFLEPRKSQIDVVQAVGRVMRRSPGKKFGYVVIPIGVPPGTTPEEALNDNERYRVIWQILNALRSHDERIEGLIAALHFDEPIGDRLQFIYQDLGSAAQVNHLTTDTPISPNGGGGNGGENGGDGDGQVPVEPPLGEGFGALWRRALAPKLVQHCGVLNTWSDWANDIAEIAQHHIARIKSILEKPENQGLFQTLLLELRDDLNPTITEQDAIEMLAQHMITRPVFDAVFGDDRFTSNNSVSQAMERVVKALHVDRIDKEQVQLEGFYESVRNRAAQVRTNQGRQELIRNLYEKFFQGAFPKLTQKLGIVYTPVEVVDFILKSVDVVLDKHLGSRLGHRDVKILDPFTGTGSFPSRLLDEETDLIPIENLQYKYTHDIHANEIVPLAYYIAGVNLESVYHSRLQEKNYQPFDGLCLADTFQSTESTGGILGDLLPRNHQRLERQLDLPIQVIIGNPPYSAGQKKGDDNAMNVRYERSDSRLQQTYISQAGRAATLKNSLYDTYIRAFRWASDRIQDRGVIGFVSNAGWLESIAGGGVRKCFVEEFAHIYVVNLRGNARTSGELRRRESGNIFGGGTQTPIAIILLVKDPNHTGPAEIHYHDIGDFLTQKEKLLKLVAIQSIQGVSWASIEPDEYGDWLNPRDPSFSKFIPLGSKDKTASTAAIFGLHSLGIATSRDAWVYNFNGSNLNRNIQRTISAYNSEIDRKQKEQPSGNLREWVKVDRSNIHWSADFFDSLRRDQKKDFDGNNLHTAAYRPFSRVHTYFSNQISNRVYRQPRLFPNQQAENRVICLEDKGSKKEFSCLMVDMVPDMGLMGHAQCFPLYVYPDQKKPSDEDFLNDQQAIKNRTFGVTDLACEFFNSQFGDANFDKEDLFYYIYGILHAPDYRAAYQANLYRELPRIPVVDSLDDFDSFILIGRELGDLHIEYESEEFPIDVTVNGTEPSEAISRLTEHQLRVSKKMQFGKDGKAKDKTKIHFNSHITVENIPLSAYDYIVSGRPAIEWIIDRYHVTVDKKGGSGIENDPNDYAIETAKDPAYILKLLLRVIQVSLKTNELVAQLPKLKIKEDAIPWEEFVDSHSVN